MITKTQPSETIYDWASIHPMIEFDWRILNLIPDDWDLTGTAKQFWYNVLSLLLYMANNLEKTIERMIKTF